MIGSILFPTDGSNFSLEAAKYAADIASKFDATVTVLHVMRHVTEGIELAVPLTSSLPGQTNVGMSVGAGPSGVIVSVNKKQYEKERGKAQNIIAHTAAVFREASVQVKERIEHGDPARVICQVVDEGGYDLVVMNSRGEGMIKAFLMGSISYYVSRHVKSPILIVR